MSGAHSEGPWRQGRTGRASGWRCGQRAPRSVWIRRRRRSSAASGHDRPPLFEGIDLFKTNALRDKIVFGTPQLLIRVARARAAK